MMHEYLFIFILLLVFINRLFQVQACMKKSTSVINHNKSWKFFEVFLYFHVYSLSYLYSDQVNLFDPIDLPNLVLIIHFSQLESLKIIVPAFAILNFA